METYRESCDGAIGNPNTVLEVPDGADFITSLLSGHENEGYDFSPVSYKLLLGGEKASVEVHSNMPSPEYHPNTLRVGAGLSNISRDCSGQYLSVVSPKRPSSAASSHLNFDAVSKIIFIKISSSFLYSATFICIEFLEM